MPIPIDHLTEAELMDLDHRVVTRLKFLHDMKLHARMLDFSVGGQQWNVAPVFLRKLSDMGQTASADGAGPEKGRSLDSGQPLARRQCIQTGGEP